MQIDDINDKIYDIAFFMNNQDWSSKEGIEYVIAWAAFQQKGSVKYSRDFGGSFQLLEQQSDNIQQKVVEFQINIINSIYSINQYRNSKPYIVLGGDYIITKQEGAKLNVYLLWVLRDNITRMGILRIDNR